jgi:hypothetical protein
VITELLKHDISHIATAIPRRWTNTRSTVRLPEGVSALRIQPDLASRKAFFENVESVVAAMPMSSAHHEKHHRHAEYGTRAVVFSSVLVEESFHCAVAQLFGIALAVLGEPND